MGEYIIRLNIFIESGNIYGIYFVQLCLWTLESIIVCLVLYDFF